MIKASKSSALYISNPIEQRAIETDWNSYVPRIITSGQVYTIDSGASTTSSLTITSLPGPESNEDVIYKLPNDDTVYRGTVGNSNNIANVTTTDISSLGVSEIPEKIMKDNLPTLSTASAKLPEDLRLLDLSYSGNDVVSRSNNFFAATNSFLNYNVTAGEQAIPYERTRAVDISRAVYDNNSFNFNSQNSYPEDIAFKPDGTKMFMAASSFTTGSGIYEYTLTEPFNLSTASYTGVYVSDIDPVLFNSVGLVVKDDGTKMFNLTVRNAGRLSIIYQWTLSTPWDLSTATYDNVSYAPGTNVINIGRSITTNDGSSLFITLRETDEIREFPLSTPWDLSTISYEGVSIDVTSVVGDSLNDVQFNADGSRMYILGLVTSDYLQYSLTTPFDITTATYDNVVLGTRSLDISGRTLRFSPDGTMAFYVGGDTTSVYRYSIPGSVNGPDVVVARNPVALASANNVVYINAINYDGVSFDLRPQLPSPGGITFNNNGTKFYTVGRGNDTIYQYSLSTPYDITTASYDNISISVSGQDSSPETLKISNDGSKLYFIGQSGDYLYQIDLSTPYDLSTAAYNSARNALRSQSTYPNAFDFSSDGTKFFILDVDRDYTIHEYTLPAPFANINSSTYSGVSFNLASISTPGNPRDMLFKDNGKILLVLDSIRDGVFQYSLSSPYDITTLQYTGRFFSTPEEPSLRSFALSQDETKLFIVGISSDSVFSYSLDQSDVIELTFNKLPFVPARVDIPSKEIVLNTPVSEQWSGDRIERIFPRQYTPLGARALQHKFVGDTGAVVYEVRYDLTQFPPGFLPGETPVEEVNPIVPVAIVEDFEDENFNITFTGDWARTTADAYEGTYSFASTNQNTDNSLSVAEATINVSEESTISFYYKVSSEEDYDFYYIYVNGSQVASLSGAGDWGFYESGPLPAGTITLKLEYSKDSSVNNNDDTAYIDLITVVQTGA